VDNRHQRSHSQPNVNLPNTTTPSIRHRRYRFYQNTNPPPLSLQTLLPRQSPPLVPVRGNLSPVSPPPLVYSPTHSQTRHSPAPIDVHSISSASSTNSTSPIQPRDTEITYRPLIGSSRNNNIEQRSEYSEDRIIINPDSDTDLVAEELSEVNNEDPWNPNFFRELTNNNNEQLDNNLDENLIDFTDDTNSNVSTDHEEEEIMSVVIKPPKFSGTSSEDPNEWLADFRSAGKANGWNDE
jgi:hypothetical protein